MFVCLFIYFSLYLVYIETTNTEKHKELVIWKQYLKVSKNSK
jgi:hypothetical protein